MTQPITNIGYEPDIYSLLQKYQNSESQADRIVYSIMNNLLDRRGIKQAIRECDYAVQAGMFSDLAKLISYSEGIQ